MNNPSAEDVISLVISNLNVPIKDFGDQTPKKQEVEKVCVTNVWMMKKLKKIKSWKKMIYGVQYTTVLVLMAENVPRIEPTSGFNTGKILLKGKKWSSVLRVSRHYQKRMIPNLISEKLIILTMNKIRLQQSQKWIKLKKILVASLLCFKARMTHLLILNCQTLRASFLHSSLDLKSFQLSRLMWIWIGEFKSKLKSKRILSKEWF